MTPEEIKARISELSAKEDWNHLFVFPDGTRTREKDVDSPGYCTNKWSRLEPILKSLSPEGKTLVDVGSSDGFFSIKAAQMGMSYVLGADIDETRIERSNFIKEAYQIPNVEFKNVNLFKADIGREFDFAFALGLIHRVPDLEGCFDVLAKLADTLIIEFKALNDPRVICEAGDGKTKGNEFNKLFSIPTASYVIEKFRERGFEYSRIYGEKGKLKYRRSIVVCSKSELPPLGWSDRLNTYLRTFF